MASSADEVRVPIAVPVETNAAGAADSVDHLRDAITRSKDVIKDAAEQMRGLRGKSDAVKAAKDQLRAAIERERNAVSNATLKLVKHGTTYERLAQQQKKAAEALKQKDADRARAYSDAVTQAGGSIARTRAALQTLTQLASKGGGLGIVALGAIGLTVAAIALVAAAGAVALALGRWALKGADAARSMQLVREASTASTLSATNLGTQVDALAKKVPTSTDALNKLGASLARSRLGGQQTVDLFNAMAQASAALGDDSAANKMKEVIERGRLTQRMYLGLFELQGTGLDFDDVAGALAESMHVGVDKARRALQTGEVSLSAGADALRKATEKKFGNINLRQMMSLDGLSQTFGKMGANLTKGIDLERAGAAVFKLIHAFDETTATGAILKKYVTMFGNGIVSAVEKGAPVVRDFLRGMIVAGLQLHIQWLKLRIAIRDAFADSAALRGASKLIERVDVLKTAFALGEFAVTSFAVGLAALGAVAFAAAYPFIVIGKAALEAYDVLDGIDWKTAGGMIVSGLIDGLTGSSGRLLKAITGLGGDALKAFRDKLMIRSPSHAMRLAGRDTAKGAEKGIDDGRPGVERAMQRIATPPPMPEPGSVGKAASAGGAGAGSPTPVTLNVTVVLQGGPAAPSAQQQLKDPGFLESVTQAFRECAGHAGIVLAPGGG